MPRPTRAARPMEPDDVRQQVALEEHDLAPDGRFAVIVRRLVRGNDYRSELWRVELGDNPGDGHLRTARTARIRRLTHGRVRDTRPRISPDGRRILFIRRELDGTEQPGRLMVVDADAHRPRRPRPMTPPSLGAAGAEWSPDGRRIAFTADVDPPRFIVGASSRQGAPPLARRIRRVDWRADETGIVDRWSHLFVVEVPAGRGRPPAPVRRTAGDWGVDAIAWRPDGREIAFSADLGNDADLDPCPAIWAVEAAGTTPATPRRVLKLRGGAANPAWSPDGNQLVAIGVDEPGPPDEISPGLFVGPAGGPEHGPPLPLATGLDRPIGQWTEADFTGWTATARIGPAWPTPDAIIATVSDRGASVPHAFDPTGQAPPRPLAEGELATQSLAVASVGERVVVTVLAVRDGRAPELFELTVDAGAQRRGSEPSAGAPTPSLRRRTTLGSAWQRRLAEPDVRRLAVPGPGGPVDTWLVSPPGTDDTPLPTVVDVHGGPLGAWSHQPPFEAHLLAGRGFRVLLPNIRGSATYGRDWIEPHLGDWGGVDAADVHAALDHVVDLGLADSDRLGLLGLSYGGFLVHWLIGTSGRFRAAVSENGVANQVSAWAHSDVGVTYNRTSRLGDPLTPDGVERLWRQSPLRHVASIRTPLLMLQAEADRRCPPADNEQLFVALRALGREVEYVLYPDEFHVFATSGRPDRRIDRHTRILDWFERHLLA